MHILLIAGGWSNEREVSLSGAKAIRQALINLGHEVEFLDPALDFEALPGKGRVADFAFINLHGSPGEDGLVQAILDQVGCPYQGAGPAGSLLALNKTATKILFKQVGIPTPKWEFLPAQPPSDWVPALDLPLFIKPNSGGSSLDVNLVKDLGQLREAMSALFAQGDQVLLEEKITGLEVTCAVLGDEALPPILIKPASTSSFFDYYSKYTPKAAQEICPAPLPAAITARVKELAVKAHKVLGLQGYSRTDFMLKGDVPFALEVNTLPGMTATSLLPQAAKEHGYSFEQLLARLIELGKQEITGQ